MRIGPGAHGHRARCSASCSPQLLDRPLAGRQGLLLPSYARLLVVLAAAQLVHQPRLLALLLEALESALEGLVLLDLDPRQKATLPARKLRLPLRPRSGKAVGPCSRFPSHVQDHVQEHHVPERQVRPRSRSGDLLSQSPKFLIKRALELEAGGMYLTLKWSAIHRRSRISKAWNSCRHPRQHSVKPARPWSRADPRCADRCASPARARVRAP